MMRKWSQKVGWHSWSKVFSDANIFHIFITKIIWGILKILLWAPYGMQKNYWIALFYNQNYFKISEKTANKVTCDYD